jgi:hypothetical protein
MARFRLVASVVLLGVGGFLAAYGLFAGGGDEPTPVTSNRYVEQASCQGCPVVLDSAEVQAREGSTLFVFRGGWPAVVGDIPGDLRLTANDLDVVLRPNGDADAFEIVDGGVDPSAIAVGLQDGALLVDLIGDVVTTPITFAFGLVEGDRFTARLPWEGMLEWTGQGRPRPVAETPAEPESPAPGEEEPAGETPEAFAEDLGAAFREGDTAFLLDRLNPAVIDVYGPRQCRGYLNGVQDPTREFDVRRVSEPEPYEYTPDGRSVPIPEAYTVIADITGGGETQRAEIHFAPVDDVLTWFTDCGEPPA